MRKVKIVVILTLFAGLYGCATGSAIVTGIVRPAIDPSEVKLYLDPPPQFETIGIVEASSDVEVSSQAAQDRTIDELKAQAAKLGANGVILLHSGEKSSDLVGFGSDGMFYAETEEAKTARGKAVYVQKE